MHRFSTTAESTRPNYPPRYARTVRAAIASVIASITFAGSPAFAADPASNALDPATDKIYRVVRERLERADAARQAGDCDAAAKLAEDLLGASEFRLFTAEEQYSAVWITALCAEERRDFLQAHDRYVALTASSLANVDAWVGRANAALNLENWGDALVALTTVAKRWPETLTGDPYLDWANNNALHWAADDPALHAQRVDFMNALFEAGYTMPFGTQPSTIWLDLVSDALERHDLARARAIAKRITDGPVLVRLNVDRRFDELVAAEPSLRDVLGATKHEQKRLAAEVAKNPRSLEVLVYYCTTLFALGEFEEILKITNSAIDKVKGAPAPAAPFDDVDAQLGWMRQFKAMTLAMLGKASEGARIRELWDADERESQYRSSHTINFAGQLARAGKPEEALKTLESVDWANDLVPYGRMQLQGVRLDAFLQLGQKDDVETVLAWIREHQRDAPATAQTALVLAGDLDSAAAVLKSRLENPDTRGDALASLQRFKRPPHVPADPTGLQQINRENHDKLLSRPDVVATVDKYGRRLTFPIYRTW